MKPSILTITGWRCVGWLGVASLCALSLLPPPPLMPEGPPYGDKFYHLITYTSLTWWFMVGHARAHWRSIAMGLALLGIILEVLQGLTPTRIPSGWDEAANVLGVLLGQRLVGLTPAGFPRFRQAE